jgi:hypothetical protein
MRQEKEEDTTEKRLLPGLFAKKAERSVNCWTSSEASQPIKLILHQNGGRTHLHLIYHVTENVRHDRAFLFPIGIDVQLFDACAQLYSGWLAIESRGIEGTMPQ